MGAENGLGAKAGARAGDGPVAEKWDGNRRWPETGAESKR